MENDEEFVKFHEEMYQELPEWIKEKSISVLKEIIPDESKEEIRKAYKLDPVHWIAPYHFDWGMWIRNMLRDRVVLDDKLHCDPELANWDNFYTKLVEIACECY